MLKWVFALLFLTNFGCATLDDENKIDLNDVGRGEIAKVDAISAAGKTAYGKNYLGEWFSCKRKDEKSTGTFVGVNFDDAAFKTVGFCDSWLAQSFLSKNFDFVGVNRPGFGGSIPPAKDFSGQNSVELIKAVMKTVPKQEKLKPLVGVWGFGSGTIAAAMAAKKNSDLSYFIGGSGIYDVEVFSDQADVQTKADINKAKGLQQSSDFNEARSVAWDVEGLPKNIILYHGKADVQVPSKQTESFSDSLSSSGYKVRLNLFEEMGHDIDPAKHRVIITTILSGTKIAP